jgi:hypothetical protein
MKQILSIIVIIVFLSVFAMAQTKSNEQILSQMKTLSVGKNIQLEFDKGSNYSKLLILSNELTNEQAKKNGLSSLTFGMMYGFNGKELTFTPNAFVLTFWAKGKNAKFAEAHNWTVNVDGEMLDLGDARYARRNSDDREFLNFSITRENLTKIAQAQNVSFSLGNFQLKFTAEQLKQFGNFVSLSDTTK